MLKQICDEFQELNDRYNEVKAELDIFRKYNKYQHGKIYKITNTEDDKVYIGCTSLPLVERMCIHRKKVGTGSMRIHKHMKKLGRDKFTIKLVKEYPTYSQWHLESEEYQVQKHFPDSVRLFKERPRIPYGLSYAEKNAIYDRRSRMRLRKLKKSQPGTTSPQADPSEEDETDLEQNSE